MITLILFNRHFLNQTPGGVPVFLWYYMHNMMPLEALLIGAEPLHRI